MPSATIEALKRTLTALMKRSMGVPRLDTEFAIDAIVVAAGASQRMAGIDKMTAILGDEPVICHALNVLDGSDLVDRIAVVVRSSEFSNMRRMLVAMDASERVLVVEGGERRQDSVKAGLDALEDAGASAEFIAVHDGARPFISDEMLRKGLDVATQFGAAVPGLPVSDTIKRVDRGLAVETPDRSEFRSIQTPQIFRREILTAAHESIREDVTDDASMVELAGGLVAVFEGEIGNIKITTPNDLIVAQAMIAQKEDGGRSSFTYRHGIGVDGHRLAPGGPLVLGGLEIEFGFHLEGHSDGDVLLHAVASSILGAAGEGDLGTNFPSTDDRYTNADSDFFVRRAAQLAFEGGWEVVHIDATVIAQRPRLGDRLDLMERSIGRILGLDDSRVNVKVTSTDGVGMIGAGEGIAAEAIATLRSSSG